MIVSGSLDRSRKERVSTDSGTLHVYRNHIVTSPAGGSPSPQAYLVEQEPNAVLRTHFHYNSQFQIFVSGTGTLGRKEVRPYVVQYADRQTGYGPITAGINGLEYLSLRPTTISQRAQYLPESRDLLDLKVPKRQVASPPMDVLADAGTYQERTMIEPTADGLAAWMVHVPRNSRKTAPVLPNGSGRFYVVVSGEMLTTHGASKALSVVWVSKEEPPLELRTLEQDLDVIIVQFPKDAW